MKKFYIAFLAGIVCLFVSCATTVNYSVLRPAELDLNGANKIGVLAFKPSITSGISITGPKRGERRDIFGYFNSYVETKIDESNVIDYIDYELKNGLSHSEYLTLVNTDEVQDALRRGYANRIVDVYLAGEIIHMDVSDEKIVNRKTLNADDKKANGPKDYEKTGPKDYENSEPKKTQVITEIKYKRNVFLEYYYEIIDADTNSVISFKKIEINESSSEYSNLRNLPDAFDIIKAKLNRNIKDILHSVQPYPENRSVSLLSNKNEKETFKIADRFVENGNFEAAYEYYYEIYKRRNVFEAGYNSAILLEAQGKYEDALELLYSVLSIAESDKHVRKVNSSIQDIKNEIKLHNKLVGQFENQADRASIY